MRTIAIIFKKELLDIIRDRRTLITMIILPLLLFPLLIGISTKIIISQTKKAQEEVLKIGFNALNNASPFKEMLTGRDDIQLIENISRDDIRDLVQSDSLAAVLVIAENFDQQLADLGSGEIDLYYKSKEKDDITRGRILDLVKDFEKELISIRLKNLNLKESVVQPIQINQINLATVKQKIGQIIGGFVPYLFIIFCFMGCMYPAIDLGAGEKERGTLETLMTTPAGRFQIMVGKFGVVTLTGIIAAVVSMIGLYVGIKQIQEIPQEIVNAIMTILGFQSIALILSMLVPLTILFAGIQLSISIFAKSFKEAQSLINPLLIVVILPAFIGLMPGFELNSVTALIPILNVSLATKEIISGTISTGPLIEVYVSMIFLALLSLYGCSKWFDREATLFRL